MTLRAGRRGASATVTQLPQHNLDAERALLGALLIEGAALVNRLSRLLSASDFYVEHHRMIYRAMSGLAMRDAAVDLLTVGAALSDTGELETVGGHAALAQLAEHGALAINPDAYVALILDASAKRHLAQLVERVGHATNNGGSIDAAIADIRTVLARLEERNTSHVEPELRREGLDLSLTWPNGVWFRLAAIRDGREGVRGELTVSHRGDRLSWGSLALSSTQAREGLRKKLEAAAPGLPWSDYLEDAAFRLTLAARQGEPILTLTGKVTSPTRELMPRLLYEGEPTLVYADGDTGKSLFALTVAIAMQSGRALPFGLRPARAVLAAYLDWETGQDTAEAREGLIAAGLGIDPPPILYKRMTRPLVDEAHVLAADFAKRGVGFVVIDSKMFAVAGGDGAAFHEPITAFYNALRLFAPAATLVLNHITNDSAKAGTPARPFGGAFAFNGPRLVWEAKRDQDVDDATAIAFTCRKANNLPRKPEPFGLRFVPSADAITIYPLDMREAAPATVAGASLPYRLRLALAGGALTIAELAEQLAVAEDTVGRTVRRLRDKGQVAQFGDGKPLRWGLAAR